jgi:hypothetical protein
MDAEEIARRVIEGFETGQITFPFTTSVYGSTYELPSKKRGDFLGPCLLLPDDPTDPENVSRGSDDAATFNRVWNEIHREKEDLTKVNAAEYDTKTDYEAALNQARKTGHLDISKWADGTIAAAGVVSFAALKTKLTSPEGL